MKRILVFCSILAAAGAAGAAGGGIASGEPTQERASEAGGAGPGQAQIAQVRRATAKFHRIEVAEEAGYVNPGAGHCIEAPGLGGMGVHVINPTLVFDGVLDRTRPEVLLYVPSSSGELRLVGVEYLVPASAWGGSESPDLFGKPFDGPMPEHEPDTTGDHYDQHAWIWSDNPDGLLATWNPSIDCP